MIKNIGRTLLVMGLLLSVPPGGRAAGTVYQDDFEDQNYTAEGGNNGLSWEVVAGSAGVYPIDQDYRVGIHRGGSLLVTRQVVRLDQFTVTLDADIVWSEPGRVIVLYQDRNNYYSVCLGGSPGIYRTLHGTEVRLKEDAGSVIRLPHARMSSGSFKIAVSRSRSGIRIDVDKAGDGVDYDLFVEDADPMALSVFKQGRLGLSTASETDGSPWFYADDITVVEGRLEDDRQPNTYYIDCVNGDDSRTASQARSMTTPWKTIQKAADIMWSGDRAVVMPGLYNESVEPASSGMPDKPITYIAYNQADKPKLDGSEVVSLSGWVAVQITDFRGIVRDVYKTTIDWEPDALFQDNVRMFESQEPNQSDPDDTFNHQEFMDVPSAYNDGSSMTTLVDPGFLTQTATDYWVGGTLMLYDGYANVVVLGGITHYDPAAHQLDATGITRGIGDDYDRDDRYALRDHLGLIDQPGEYYVNTSVTPYEVYVWPYATSDLSTITAARYDVGFDLSGGYIKNIVIDGFDVSHYNGSGVSILRGCENITVKNCDIHHNMGSGVNVSQAQQVIVRDSNVYSNYNNGISFGYGEDYTVEGCDVTENGNNGIWVGTGGGGVFNASNILIRNNRIHHQGGLRMHPDNHQMHQVKNIVFEGNLLIQDGHQNMWTQYCDQYVLRNNIFIGGTLGINSTMHSYIYHNVFYKSSLRYDAHLEDHPEYGDYYKPQEVRIQNNIIVDSAITMPDQDVVDWSAFIIDHNYYNIENNWLVGSWGERGVGFDVKSIVERDHATFAACVLQEPDAAYTTFDFHLAPGSPCIDAGLSLDVADDKDGNSRPQKSLADIGPYEKTFDFRVPGTDPVYVMNNILSPGKDQEAVIRCCLQQPSKIIVKLYASEGRQIIKLADGHYLDGVHHFRWSGKDQQGQDVGSGIYWVYVKIGAAETIRKIAVIR